MLLMTHNLIFFLDFVFNKIFRIILYFNFLIILSINLAFFLITFVVLFVFNTILWTLNDVILPMRYWE